MIIYRDELESAPDQIQLDEGEIQIWRIALDQAHSQAASLIELLAPDERQRAGRFYRQQDRDRFTMARGMLRAVLARYLAISPAQLRFTYNSYGKPALPAVTDEGGRESGDCGLRFNVSHSNELALIAVTRGSEVGVDVEFMREDLASLEIAERFFSEPEVAALRALPAERQMAAFFNCWTRKEAYIKALGEGLSHPLNRFTVSLNPGGPVTLSIADDDPGESEKWRLYDLEVAPGYVGALAIELKR